ncbi:MAG: hypothetical protein AB1726_08340 [Planctomycetota bacterium]
MRGALLLPLFLLGFSSAPAQELRVPPGPAGAAWAEVGADTLPAALPGGPWPLWTARGTEGWGAEAPWQRWAALVAAEAEAERPDPERRALLALFARARGRDFDAWDHFAACAGAPGVLAALAPGFFPGVPPGHPATAGGSPAPLGEGVLLTPALPPRPFPDADPPPLPAEAALEHGGFAVGESRIAMRLVLERDGVQVDLHHLAGPPVRLSVLLPVPPREEIAVTYQDWLRQEGGAGPLKVTLGPAEAMHELWGRFQSRPAPWPGRLPSEAPAQVALAGLELAVPAAELASPFLVHFARALGAVLGVPCGLVAAGAPPPEGTLAPLAIHLPADRERERKIAGMISLAEGFALRPRPTR